MLKAKQKRPKKQKCIYCGCTQENACAGGCWWVAPNVCSNCEELFLNETYTMIEEQQKLHRHFNGQVITTNQKKLKI